MYTTFQCSPSALPVPKHVLVAEDDTELRRLLVCELSRDGHLVSSISDGGELLDYLRGSALEGGFQIIPDLLVCDVRMPVWNGTDALELIRALGWRFPVILISAFADEELHRFGAARGATVIGKPFDFDELRARVIEDLQRTI
ncbi:MAG: response regulator [Deltaproteobacteria bacterium]|nr:response regulator [Deltaproteobacteria bacterium]